MQTLHHEATVELFTGSNVLADRVVPDQACICQASLGGDAKTLMFLNIAPEASAAQESLCSLRFAAKVNSCEIGTARRNTGGK